MRTPADWGRVKEVLAGALACDADARAAFVVEACRSDAALQAEVERLLAVNDQAGTFLETPAAKLLRNRPTRISADAASAPIG
jgi:hypothetical protein